MTILSVMMKFPEDIEKSVTAGREFSATSKFEGEINNVVFTGMGGSAIGADVIKSLCESVLNVPVCVNRGYRLPFYVNEKTLLIVSSYSGNTEETCCALREGLTKKARIIILTTGGRIGVIAGENNIPVISMPGGYPPRQALAFSVFLLFPFFEKLFHYNMLSDSLREIVGMLENMRDNEIGPAVSFERNIAKKTASKLVNKFPVIYSFDEDFAPVALRWRGQLEENSKVIASHHVIPEMNHNEIMGWQKGDLAKSCAAILLKDEKSRSRLNERLEITKKIISSSGAEVIEIESRGEHILCRVLSLIYTADFVSLYLAVLNSVNPTSIDNIDYLKQELARKGTL